MSNKGVKLSESNRRNCYFYCDRCGKLVPMREKLYIAEFTEGGLMCFCDRCFKKTAKEEDWSL